MRSVSLAPLVTVQPVLRLEIKRQLSAGTRTLSPAAATQAVHSCAAAPPTVRSSPATVAVLTMRMALILSNDRLLVCQNHHDFCGGSEMYRDLRMRCHVALPEC